MIVSAVPFLFRSELLRKERKGFFTIHNKPILWRKRKEEEKDHFISTLAA
jgi:hypothetical protein